MKQIKFFTRIVIFAACLNAPFLSCQADSAATAEKSADIFYFYNDFRTNPYLSHEMRRAIKPFILPPKHSLKAKLDAIFLRQRAIKDVQSFRKAGFNILFYKPRSFIRVARHPHIPGYLFKVYLDSELQIKRHKPGWYWLASRCKGASKVRKIIYSKKIQYFDVARKWLYPLPLEPSPPKHPAYIRQPVVLIVKDMKLVSEKDNYVAWKTKITKAHLDELYTIIKFAKGHSYRPDNIWLSTSGKFCFIDTEYPSKGPDFRGIRPHLNKEMRTYWDHLVQGE